MVFNVATLKRQAWTLGVSGELGIDENNEKDVQKEKNEKDAILDFNISPQGLTIEKINILFRMVVPRNQVKFHNELIAYLWSLHFNKLNQSAKTDPVLKASLSKVASFNVEYAKQLLGKLQIPESEIEYFKSISAAKPAKEQIHVHKLFADKLALPQLLNEHEVNQDRSERKVGFVTTYVQKQIATISDIATVSKVQSKQRASFSERLAAPHEFLADIKYFLSNFTDKLRGSFNSILSRLGKDTLREVSIPSPTKSIVEEIIPSPPKRSHEEIIPSPERRSTKAKRRLSFGEEIIPSPVKAAKSTHAKVEELIIDSPVKLRQAKTVDVSESAGIEEIASPPKKSAKPIRKNIDAAGALSDDEQRNDASNNAGIEEIASPVRKSKAKIQQQVQDRPHVINVGVTEQDGTSAQTSFFFKDNEEYTGFLETMADDYNEMLNRDQLPLTSEEEQQFNSAYQNALIVK